MAGGEGSSMGAEAAAEAEIEMDRELSRGAWVPRFEFAFNSQNFSDRLLRIEMVASDAAGGSLPESARHREEDKGTPVIRVKTVYINSAILAARSPFFLKLFSNGMKESDQTHTTLRVADSEENALMEILSFMYSGKLTATEPTLLFDILMAADKFEVLSCMRHCSQLLTKLPMTTEFALLYLDHPCSISMAAEVQHLIIAAKKFLANKYKDVHKFRGELMNFPLAGIEAVFSSTDLQVLIEDSIYTFILQWARARYPELEERRKILSSRLLPLVRFSQMSCARLWNVLTCTDEDINHDQVKKCITRVLMHKAYPAHVHGDLAAEETTYWQFAERTYMCKPVKLVAFDGPCPQVIAYWDLKREECSRLLPSQQILSHPLHHAGLDFLLVAGCIKKQVNGLYRFGLYLQVSESSPCVTLEYEFAAKTKASGKFVSRFEAKCTSTLGGLRFGCDNVFGIPWPAFIADNNLFVNGVLHLRVDLTMREQLESRT